MIAVRDRVCEACTTVCLLLEPAPQNAHSFPDLAPQSTTRSGKYVDFRTCQAD